jgi:hypothetical protein
MFAGRTLAALVLAGGIVTGPAAYAAETTPTPPATPAQAATPDVPAPPSPAALKAADQLLTAMGVKESIAKTVPTMMTEFERNITTTRPEIRDSLRETLVSIKPAFDNSAKQTYEKAEVLLALAMTEKELQDVATFFTGPTGKKFLAIQPLFLQRLQDVLEPWRQGLSTDIVAKAREEMKKKGVDF